MKKIKQYLFQRRTFIVFLLQIIIIMETVSQFKEFFNGGDTSFFSMFSCLILIMAGFAFMLIFSLTPYIENIATNIKVKEKKIKFPKLYSFADSLEFKIEVSDDQDLSDLLESEKSYFNFLDLNKFEIKILDENNKEIKIDIHTSQSKSQNINIKLENKTDILKANSISIKSEKEINLNLVYISYNRK
jgi:hypothetical protein